MSRRKPEADNGGGLDSLMDALTNVVAVLIVILILLQIDVEQTVERLLDEMIPATPEEVQQARVDAQAAREELRERQELLDSPAPTPEQLQQAVADLSQLEKSVTDSSALLLSLQELVKLEEKTTAESKVEKEKTDALLKRLSELEALLDQTPRPEAAASAVVSIPNSREIPNNANLYYCYVIGDQVHLVDPGAAEKLVMEEFEKVERDFIQDRVRERGERTRIIYDQTKTVEFFATKDLKIRNQKIVVPFNKPWTRLNVQVRLDPAKGDASLADMEVKNGRFHKMMEVVKSYTRPVLIFKVNSNGFATYLKARQIADEFDIACGWEVDNGTTFSQALPFEVNRLEEPPPPKPQTGPAPPARKLD